MARKKPLISDDGEVRELTAADMARFKPASKVLSPAQMKKLGKRRWDDLFLRGPRASEDFLSERRDMEQETREQS